MNNIFLIEVNLIDKKIMVGIDIVKLWDSYTDEPMEYFTFNQFLRQVSIMENLENKKNEQNINVSANG